MRLYLAGNGNWYDALDETEGVSFLQSYFYIQTADGWKWIEYADRRGWPVFLDSGGFSAFALGKNINLGEYTNFCKEHGRRFETIAYLDVIGDWKKSKENYERMADAGVEGIPTFHVGEPVEFYDYLIKNWRYVAIGGMVPYLRVGEAGTYKNALMRFLVMVHKKAKDAGVKLHGFGLTTWRLMKVFPWYSIDSSRWLAGNRFGKALVFSPELSDCIAREEPRKVYHTAQKINFTGDINKVIPRRSMKSTEYYPLVRFNAEVMYHAVGKL